MKNIDFVIVKSDDVWIRDTGPLFVKDNTGKVVIADFSFDGWGEKVPYEKDDLIPSKVALSKGFQRIPILDMVLEGGSIEFDGFQTAMLCASSVLSKNRNPDMHKQEVEEVMLRYLGITNFIWLQGVVDEDITDAHIDGIARFYNEDTILTVTKKDFLDLYEGIQERDYTTLIHARNNQKKRYKIITLPMTKENVKGVDYKGSYLNYYVGNEIVLVPTYEDVHDQIALTTLQKLYTSKRIVPINVQKLYPYGGMLHCITQQQPL